MRIAAVVFLVMQIIGMSVAQSPHKISNSDVLKMVRAGLSEDIVLTAIKQAPASFATSPDDLIALKNGGATPKEIEAILTRADVSMRSSRSTDTPPSPVAGQWTTSVVPDKMNGRSLTLFALKGSSENGGAAPELEAWCDGNGKVQFLSFSTSDVIDTTDHSPFGAPDTMVLIRTENPANDGKVSWERRGDFWNISSNFHMMFPSKGSFKRTLDAETVYIQYGTFGGNVNVAEFHPSSLDRVAFAKACGKDLLPKQK